MYTIISPSKTQDFERKITLPREVTKLVTIPEWNKQTKSLVTILKTFKPEVLSSMMNISANLAELNFERFKKWNGVYNKNKNTVAPAIIAFQGDVYKGFDLENWKIKDYKYAHKHLGIISGFYGLISPLNYIQPYRLEMGTRISFAIKDKNNSGKYKNLYDFWNELLTDKIINILKQEQVLINLASVEYSKVLDRNKLREVMGSKGQIIDVDFKSVKINKKTGKQEEKVIAIYAKRVRGLMANWIITNNLKNPRELENFRSDNWRFKGWSKADKLGNKRVLFIRLS